MGLGAGHVADMINRLKQNRAQRPSNRSKFKENNREGIYSSDKIKEKPQFKTVPEEELNLIKHQIREKAKADRRREFIIYGIISLVIFITLVLAIIL